MARHIGVRDEYEPRFGRQVLTLWEGPFCSVYDGYAVELPKHDGFMVTLDPNGEKVRVACPAPRTGENFEEVDRAIEAAVTPIFDRYARLVVTRDE
jgi:hypothetical protein